MTFRRCFAWSFIKKRELWICSYWTAEAIPTCSCNLNICKCCHKAPDTEKSKVLEKWRFYIFNAHKFSKKNKIVLNGTVCVSPIIGLLLMCLKGLLFVNIRKFYLQHAMLKCHLRLADLYAQLNDDDSEEVRQIFLFIHYSVKPETQIELFFRGAIY